MVTEQSKEFSLLCENLGKTYNFSWIFRNLTYQFYSNHVYGICGHNGSGKSTFLKMISGYLTPNEGKVILNLNYDYDNKKYPFFSFNAPYIELIQEMSVMELFKFIHSMKPFKNFDQVFEEIKNLPFQGILTKTISELSSGTKQRIKLITTVCSNSKVLLCDEPGSNLDKEGLQWWTELLQRYKKDKIVLIATNDEFDYQICDKIIDLSEFKYKSKLKKIL